MIELFMNETVDPIILALALIAIGIAFKADIIRACKIDKEKTKKKSNKTVTDDDNACDFNSGDSY